MNRKRIFWGILIVMALLAVIPLTWTRHLEIDKPKFTEEWYKALVAAGQLFACGVLVDILLKHHRREEDRSAANRGLDAILRRLPAAVTRVLRHLEGKEDCESDREAMVLLLAHSVEQFKTLATEFSSSEHSEFLIRLGFRRPEEAEQIPALLTQVLRPLSQSGSFDSSDREARQSCRKVVGILESRLPEVLRSR